MHVISRNIVANFVAKAIGAFTLIFCTPFYIANMGLEKFGLVGFYNTLLVIFSVLDFGFGTTLNRYLAQNYDRKSSNRHCQGFLYSIETIYFWAILALFVILLSVFPKYSHLWFQASEITSYELKNSISLILISTLLMWPISLYYQGLKGTQHQVLENTLVLIASLSRHLGGIIILAMWPGNICYYFAWQAFINLILLVIARMSLWSKIAPFNATRSRRFSFTKIKDQMRFSKNIFIQGILALIIIQYDKVALSKLIPLDKFACYTTAATLATGLSSFLSTPLQSAFFPAFSKAISKSNLKELTRLSSKYSDLIGGIFISISVISFAFGFHFINFIMPTESSAQLTTTIFRLFLIGYAFHGIAYVDISILFSAGKTRLIIWINAIYAIAGIPIALYLCKSFGYLPFCIGWIILNLAYMPILLFSTSRLFPTLPIWTSLAHRLLYPVACSTPFALIAIYTESKSLPMLLIISSLSTLCACICSLAISSSGREIVLSYMRLIKSPIKKQKHEIVELE